MPWAPPAPAHSSRVEAGARPEFSSHPSSWWKLQCRQRVTRSSLWPPCASAHPRAALPVTSSRESTSRWIVWEHHHRASASRGKKNPKPPFPKPLQPPRTSQPPGESKGHPGLVRSGSPSTQQLPHPTGTSLPVPQGPNPAGFRSFRRYRGPKSWEASPGASQSFGPWAQPFLWRGLRRGQRNGAVTNPPAHSSPWEQTQLSGSSLLAPGSRQGVQGTRMEFAGRQNRGSPRCLLWPSMVKVLKRRVI